MVDPQPCAANAGDSSNAGYICMSGLPSPKRRRTLDSVSGKNRKAAYFLDTFVTEYPITSEQSVRLYNMQAFFFKSGQSQMHSGASRNHYQCS